MKKLTISEEACRRLAKLEGDSEVGAGFELSSVVSEFDRKIMGTPEAAREDMIAKAREWRELRQPFIGTSKELRERDDREREVRLRLCGAVLLWLWHEEHPASATST